MVGAPSLDGPAPVPACTGPSGPRLLDGSYPGKRHPRRHRLGSRATDPGLPGAGIPQLSRGLRFRHCSTMAPLAARPGLGAKGHPSRTRSHHGRDQHPTPGPWTPVPRRGGPLPCQGLVPLRGSVKPTSRRGTNEPAHHGSAVQDGQVRLRWGVRHVGTLPAAGEVETAQIVRGLPLRSGAPGGLGPPSHSAGSRLTDPRSAPSLPPVNDPRRAAGGGAEPVGRAAPGTFAERCGSLSARSGRGWATTGDAPSARWRASPDCRR